MAEARVGIVVEAVDKVSAALTKIGQVGGGALKELDKGSKAASAGWKDFRQTIIALNQGVNLAKQVFAVFREAVLGSVQAAMAFRDANDPAVKQLKLFQTSLESIQARVGDVLIPIFQGLADGIGPVIEQFRSWIAENRILLGTKLVEWLAEVGKTAIGVVAKAIIYVSRAWSGWLEIISVVKIAVSEYFKLSIQGAGLAMRAMATLASAAGQDGLAKSIAEAHNALIPLWEEFDAGSTQAQIDLQETINKQDALEAQVAKFEGVAQKVWGQTTVAMLKRVQEGTVGLNMKLEDQKKILDKLTEAGKKQLGAMSISFGAQADKYKRIADFSEASAKQQEKDQDALTDKYQSAASTVSDAMGTCFADIITGSEGAGKAMLSSIVKAAMGSITAYALTAAAGAASAEAGIPIVGPILAGVAMAAMSALVMALLSQLPSFHTGGVVGAAGGMTLPGMRNDERIVKALVGERFLAPGQSSDYSSRQRPAREPRPVSIQLINNSLFAPESAQTQRQLKAANKLTARLARQGAL